MWECKYTSLNDGQALRCVPLRDGSPARFREVLKLWRDDEDFRSSFITILESSKFDGYRWETPPITTATVDRPFEFVLLDAPGLDQAPDASAFGEQFARAGHGQTIVTFSNLGNDAILVVPCPRASDAAYVHLASFIRQAPETQKHELWRTIGVAMEQRLGRAPVWLSTAGMGVAWLHVRLDDRPKYYGHAPYRVLP